MLIYLSFTAYLSYSAGVMLLYYAAVWFLFYFKKPSVLSSSASSAFTKQSIQPNPFDQHRSANERKETAPDEFPLVHDLVDELNALLLQLNAEKADKEQVDVSLQRLLQKYPTLNGSDYQASINHLIGVETENKCGLHFSAEEILNLWN